MNSARIVALVLIVLGVVALLYGSFSYTKDSTPLKVGSYALSIRHEEKVNIPMWAGIAAIVGGGFIFALGGRRGG